MQMACRPVRVAVDEGRIIVGAQEGINGRGVDVHDVLRLLLLCRFAVFAQAFDNLPALREGAGKKCTLPLRIARGVQNKVLEGLAMGKRVLASPAVCSTFGDRLPEGVVRCESAAEYGAYGDGGTEAAIRLDACEAFRWERSLAVIEDELSKTGGASFPGSPRRRGLRSTSEPGPD